MSETALEMRAVTKRYRDGARGEVFAVRDVSLRVSAGELVMLRGASGAGKSTIIGLAAGIVLPTAGEVLLRGEVFSRTRESFRAAMRRASMGVVLQGLALVPRMTVLENVSIAGVPDGDVGREATTRAREALARFGIERLASARIELLSGGEKQRVALARAMLRDPELLLLDEPSAHLDGTHVDTLAGALKAALTRGAVVLVATHDPRLASALGTARVLDVVDGSINA